MDATTSKGQPALDIYDGREDLLSNVQSLRERITLTERTLASLSSPRKTVSQLSKRQSYNSPRTPQALTLAELHATPFSKQASLDTAMQWQRPGSSGSPTKRFYFSKHNSGVDMVDAAAFAPGYLAASGDTGAEETVKRLHELEQSNTVLMSERNILISNLETAQSQLNKLSSSQSQSDNEVATYKNLVSQLQDSLIDVQQQVQIQDSVLRKAESRNSASQQEAADGSKRLKQCSEMLKITEERMKEQQNLIKSLRLERDEALSNAEELGTQLTSTKAADSYTVLSLKDELQKRERERTTLKTQTKELKISLAKVRQEFSEKDKQYSIQSSESSHLALVNETLNGQVKELKAKFHSLQCEVIESKTFHKQNTELQTKIAQLSNQLTEKDDAIISEKKHNGNFIYDIQTLQSELKSKTLRVNTLEEQFGFMENGLLKQKERINSLEAELHDVDQIKMENIELKCKIDEAERKLKLCQQEMIETSGQLGKLESLATRIESREKLNSSESQQDLSELRTELIDKTHEVNELRITLDETEAKLRLSQLALDAKEKVLKRSTKFAVQSDKMRLQSEIGRLKTKLTESDGKCTLLQNRVKELQTELSNGRRKLESSIQNNKNLKQQKSACEAEIKNMKSKILELEKSAQLHSTDIEEQHSITERLQRQVTSLKQDLLAKTAEKDGRLDSLQQQCELWQHQLTSVQKQKDDFKQRLSSLQSEYTDVQGEIIKLDSQLELKQKSLEEVTRDLELAHEETNTVNLELSSHIQSCELRISQLESTLSVAREECEALSRQLHEEKSAYERHLSEKDGFIKEYQTRLKTSQSSLQDAESELCKLRQELQENRQTESESAQKVHKLEEQLSALNSQIWTMEQTLQRVGISHQNEALGLKERLQAALEELEDSKSRRESLSNQLTDLEKDKESLLTEVESLEGKLSQISASDRSRMDRLKELEARLAETQELLTQKDDDVVELEGRLQKMEIDLEHHTLLNTQFEGEFRRAQNDLKSAMTQCEELQDMLSVTRDEKRSLETRFRDTEKSLRRAQDELSHKIDEIEELDNQIKKQEKQLLNRAQQVSQLDVTINSYRGEVETQLRQTGEQLKRCQEDRDRKAEDTKKLHDEVTGLSRDLEICTKELTAAQSHARKLQQDLQEKSTHVSELETRLDNLEDKSEGLLHGLTTRSEEIDAKNELIRRYENQVERLQFELAEVKIERQTMLEKYNQARQELQQYLDTVYSLEQRLIGCEKSHSGKTDGLEGAKKELEQIQQQHRAEIARLEDAQRDFMDSKQSMENNYQSRVREMEAKERQLTKQLQLSHDQIEHLRAELQRRLELVKNSNEAVVIKEAEIARLEARISGIERRWVVTDNASSPYRANYLPEQTDDLSTCSSLPSSILQNGSYIGSHKQDRITPDEDLLLQKQKATRALFSPARKPSAGSDNSKLSTSCVDSLDLATAGAMSTDRDHRGTIFLGHVGGHVDKDDDSVVSHDDTLAQERKELFNRLDELNKDLPESPITHAASQTVTHLIQSAARSAERDVRQPIPGQNEDDGSSSESLCAMKPGPAMKSSDNCRKTPT